MSDCDSKSTGCENHHAGKGETNPAPIWDLKKLQMNKGVTMKTAKCVSSRPGLIITKTTKTTKDSSIRLMSYLGPGQKKTLRPFENNKQPSILQNGTSDEAKKFDAAALSAVKDAAALSGTSGQGKIENLPLDRSIESPAIISVAQFRPEKAHTLQLEAFSIAIRKLEEGMKRPKLQFVGSCRNKADEERLQKLRDLAIELEVQQDVKLYKNLMYQDLVELLGSAVAGIHSMMDEHFGICVVEYMAAGAIPIGPKMDIVLEEDGQQTGFLAQTAEEYADAVLRILRMSEAERLVMAAAARRRAARFSEQRFYQDLKAAVRPILFSSTDEQ